MSEVIQVNTTAQAHVAKIKAKRKRLSVHHRPESNLATDRVNRVEADALDTAASMLLYIPESIERGMGGELAPPSRLGYIGQADAVKRPDAVSLGASIERIELVDNCGAFNLGFDVAETINAQNATEQMLAHQMAAAHKLALELLAKSANQRDTIEQARLANSAARLMDTYQRAMLTLVRVRTGGRQLVTVQHVQVSGGGPTVINGAVQTGGSSAGGQ